MKDLIKKFFGSSHTREAKKLRPLVDEINEIFRGLEGLTEEELKGKTLKLARRRHGKGEMMDAEAAALAANAAAKVREEAVRLHLQAKAQGGEDLAAAARKQKRKNKKKKG